jgi:protein-S-isoprenylcysteine O-methyltransferase Ste14
MNNPFFSNRKSLLAFPRQPSPTSTTHTGYNLLAILLPLTLTYWSANLGIPAMDIAAIAIASTIAAFLFLEVFIRQAHLNEEMGLSFNNPHWSIERSMTKLLGLTSLITTIAFLYWLLPEYGKNLYSPSFAALKAYGWIFPILAIPYFIVIDAFQRDPHDHYWQLGRLILWRNHFSNIRKDLTQLALGWLVKAFFLPLMFSFLITHIEGVQSSAGTVKASMEHILFGIDVMIGTVGYLMTLRLLGTHIRSTEPTLLGWTVALVCYPPFNNVIFRDYIGYRHFMDFSIHDSKYFILGYLLEIISLLTLTIYTLATVSFGIRFSNLTHRGIITGGPYRYWKHPAYLAKNLFWWTEVIIYLPMEFASATRLIVLMFGVSTIYWARAKTEERHLRKDPDYLIYEAWIAEHGFYPRMKKFFSKA